MSWADLIPAAARAYLETNRLDEVECIIADLPGIARGKAVPASKWERQQYFHLPNSIFFQTITGDWSEASIDGFTEPDMTLRPDLSTATAAPCCWWLSASSCAMARPAVRSCTSLGSVAMARRARIAGVCARRWLAAW